MDSWPRQARASGLTHISANSSSPARYAQADIGNLSFGMMGAEPSGYWAWDATATSRAEARVYLGLLVEISEVQGRSETFIELQKKLFTGDDGEIQEDMSIYAQGSDQLSILAMVYEIRAIKSAGGMNLKCNKIIDFYFFFCFHLLTSLCLLK